MELQTEQCWRKTHLELETKHITSAKMEITHFETYVNSHKLQIGRQAFNLPELKLCYKDKLLKNSDQMCNNGS